MANQSLLRDVNNLFRLISPVSCRIVLASVSVENKEHQHVYCHIFPTDLRDIHAQNQALRPGTKVAAAGIASNPDDDSEI